MTRDEGMLRAALARFQRRAALTLFLRVAARVFAMLGLALTGLILAGKVPPIAGLAVGAAVALVAAAVTVLIHRPGAREVAHAIDLRGNCANCVATALQMASADDAVARLVVRDARSHLERIVPADIFPVTTGLNGRRLGAAAAAGLLLFVVGHSYTGSGAAWTMSDGSGGVASEAGSPAGRPAPRRSPSTSGTAATPSLESLAGTRATAAPTRVAPADPGRAAEGGARTGRPEDMPAPAAPGAVPPPPQARAEGPSGAGRGSGATARPASTVSGTTAGRGQTSRNGDGPGGPGTRQGAIRRAGGARGGGVADRDAGLTAGMTPSTATAARYRAAAARAEQAMDQDGVPDDLRDLVRAYFTAIRP